MRVAVLIVSALMASGVTAYAAAGVDEPAAPQAVTAAALQQAIDTLGALDYDARTSASRLVRRTAPAQAVPALLRAVAEHSDGYVRYRALVLLTGFNDPRVRETLVREAGRGEDFFRSAVIEALGDYKVTAAFDTLKAIAALDGPLQDDAALALGRLGDARALETLAMLQRTAPRTTQPAIAAAICLLGVNCGSHEHYLTETLKFADASVGYQELLRGAATGLAQLGLAGKAEAVTALLDVGIPSRDPTRSPVALALATVALRNTALLTPMLERHPDRAKAIDLVAEGFDMLDEDYDKERFFALARRTYWDAAEGSPSRDLAQALIGKLDF